MITEKKSGNLLGIIDIIAPATARAHYHLERYPYFIEFYLKAENRKQGLMSRLLPLLITEMAQRDIMEIGAVINRQNHAARKVLDNAGFDHLSEFDIKQDLYLRRLDKKSLAVRRAG